MSSMTDLFIHSCLYLSGDKIGCVLSEDWYLLCFCVYTEALVLRDREVMVGLILFLI